eukprot:CAMPEP_0185214170 /NCGR_PEP_ID=MMETSP1140-20130426/68397_1 /TAXON_ID=298111 /ORGANISM="Pavlova sp., Strain CCMP459" /LENGTH=140 /DNA_ID=CAMNT_0027782027 /DNA_START=805 /DNA_END=1224 /DNA_ORIENTATION=-
MCDADIGAAHTGSDDGIWKDHIPGCAKVDGLRHDEEVVLKLIRPSTATLALRIEHEVRSDHGAHVLPDPAQIELAQEYERVYSSVRGKQIGEELAILMGDVRCSIPALRRSPEEVFPVLVAHQQDPRPVGHPMPHGAHAL